MTTWQRLPRVSGPTYMWGSQDTGHWANWEALACLTSVVLSAHQKSLIIRFYFSQPPSLLLASVSPVADLAIGLHSCPFAPVQAGKPSPGLTHSLQLGLQLNGMNHILSDCVVSSLTLTGTSWRPIIVPLTCINPDPYNPCSFMFSVQTGC